MISAEVGEAPPEVATAESAANADAASPARPSAGIKDEMAMSSTFSTLSELKTKAPKLYKAMMQGIAMSITSDMQDHQERLKKIIREAEEN